jgi:inverted formin-2
MTSQSFFMSVAVNGSRKTIPSPPPLPLFLSPHSPPIPSTFPTPKDGEQKKIVSPETFLSKTNQRIYSKHKSKKKMKSLFWTKIPSNESQQSPLWQSMSIDLLDSLPINYQILEERFATHDHEIKSSKRRNSILDSNSFRPKSLLDNGRTQNILISAGKIRGTSESILTLLKELNPTILTEEIVKILQNIIPTPEEICLLRSYEGDRTLLGSAEQLLFPLCEVPRISQRLFCHLTMLTWSPSAQKISHQLSILEKIYCELCTDNSLNHLTKILQYTLAIGNFLNNGSHRVSTAIRLSSILKFQDIRSDQSFSGTETSGNQSPVAIISSNESTRYTLLTFLVSELMRNCPHSLRYICESWSEIFSIMEGDFSLSQLTIDTRLLQVLFIQCRLSFLTNFLE